MENKNYLVFSSINWDTHRQLHHELVDYLLLQKNKVLYIENTGTRNLRFSDLTRVFQRIFTWFKSRIGFDKINDQFSLFSPILFPYPFNRIFIFLNYLILIFLIKRWIRKNNFTNIRIISFLPTPLIQKIIVNLSPDISIYYCADNYISQTKFFEKFMYYEKNMFINSDLSLFTSEHLKIKNNYPFSISNNLNFHTIHNGVDFEKFFNPKIMKTELDNINKTIIGFHGALRSIIDFELLIKITKEIQNALIVLIGPIYEINLNKIINNNNNILYLGEKSHDLIPSYIKKFDIGLIPYKKDEFTNCIYPVKLNEYLAMGLPVIANDLNEIKIFNKNNNNIIAVASTHEEFIIKIKECISNTKSITKPERIEIARKNSWNEKFKLINSYINQINKQGTKKTILFNGSIFSDIKDGARERFLNLVDNFSKISSNYKLVVLESKNYNLRNEFDKKNSILFIKSPLRSYNPFQRFIVGLFYFNKLFNELRIDYFDTSYIPLITSKKIKTLFTIHDTRYLSNQKWISMNRRLIGKYLTLKAIQFAHLVICVSETEKINLMKNKLINKIEVIPNGISTFFINDNHSFNNNLKLKEGYILTVGRLEYRKNIILLIESFEYLVEDFYKGHLAIIGSDAGFRKEIFHKIRNSKFSNRIHLFQDVDAFALKNYYKGADLFVFPSLFEGFGIPILEAMSQSTPYLLSDLKVFKEITKNKALYFDRNSPIDCKEKMKLILQNKSIQEKILSNSFEILEKYSWNTSSTKYLNALNNI